MTIGMAWVGQRGDGHQHLYFASDSRVTGGQRFDACPKILTLDRSDCVLCFAGDTQSTYPLMIQIANAIAAHQPARDRSLDIGQLKGHILRVLNDLVGRVHDYVGLPLASGDAQFLFGGYSWRDKRFRLWTIDYLEIDKRFFVREATSFHERLSVAAFIGDKAKPVRSRLVTELSQGEGRVYLEPLRVLATCLEEAGTSDSIGGAPQLVRVTEHMNTRSLCVRWKGEDTLFGRALFDYENIDYWIVEPFTGKFYKPRKFGRRDEHVDCGEVADLS